VINKGRKMTQKELQDFDYEAHQNLVQMAAEDGISILHIRADNTDSNIWADSPFGGCTVAWKRTTDHRNGRMVEVSVSFCSPNDTFCRRVGSFNALSYFYDGQVILLPVGHQDSENVVLSLRRVFMPLVNRLD
jgi:hypothetical protein